MNVTLYNIAVGTYNLNSLKFEDSSYIQLCFIISVFAIMLTKTQFKYYNIHDIPIITKHIFVI